MLSTKKSFKYRAEHTVDVVRKALSSDHSFVSTYSEYKMVTTVAFDDKVHHFYINDQEMCRIYQNIEDVQKVVLHIGYVLDGNGDPSARTKEHINAILATLAEDDWLPQIRLYWDKQQECVLLGACDPDGPRVQFNSKYTKMAFIHKDNHVNSKYGFELDAFQEDLWK